jgi:hypothetical protein
VPEGGYTETTNNSCQKKTSIRISEQGSYLTNTIQNNILRINTIQKIFTSACGFRNLALQFMLQVWGRKEGTQDVGEGEGGGAEI